MNTNPLHDLAMIRKISLYCAAVTLAVACLMSFKFGWSMSLLHAFGLGLITICTALIFPYIGHQWKGGSKGFAACLAPVAALLCMVEFGTHTGYTNGVRTIETEGAGYVNANYKTKQDSVARNAKQLSDYKASLAELQAQNAWAATVSADGLRAQIVPMDLAITQETARGGCGPKCLKLTQDKAAIQDKIAIAEKAEDLSRQIALFQGLVNSKETEATAAEFKSSEVVAQTNIFAKAAAWSLDPTDAQKEGTQIGVGFAMALATTFLPAVFMLMAFGPAEFVPGAGKRIAAATEKATDEASAILRDVQALMARQASAPSASPSTHTHEKEVLVLKEDDPRAKAAYAAMGILADGARKLKAA
ncbi:MAG: hypothetical protein WC807_18645 [Hyphomicrobium sp.]|jgi:hypothetical protein